MKKLTDAEYNANPTTAKLNGKRLDKKIKAKFARKAKKITPEYRPKAMQNYKYAFVHGDTNNMKLGERVASWSTLMGSTEYIVLEMDGMAIRGTCHNCEACEGDCYVKKSYRHSNCIFSHARNTWGLRNERSKVFSDLAKSACKLEQSYFRINQSGDIESEDEFFGWIMVAEQNPGKKFYLYTKMFDIVTPVLKSGNVPKILQFCIVYGMMWVSRNTRVSPTCRM